MCLCKEHTANNDKLNIFYVIYVCFLIDIIIQMSSTLKTNKYYKTFSSNNNDTGKVVLHHPKHHCSYVLHTTFIT